MSTPSPRLTVAQIDALLPQTQCGLCKHPGCRPYAEAIAAGEDINHCVPGGEPTIRALAELTGRAAKPLDPDYGTTPPHRLVALIREDECIGCTKCIQACPVDAIVGAAKRMHTVLIDECTGCNLCVPPCPVDCIDLVPGPDIPMTWHHLPGDDPAAIDAHARAQHARRRFEARNRRLQAQADAEAARRAPIVQSAPADRASLMIAAAMARTQLKKAEKQLAQLTGDEAAALAAQLPDLRAAVAAAERALAAAS